MKKYIDFKVIPSCSSAEDYQEWHKLMPPTGRYGFCEDCTPRYKMKMMNQGRCEHPEVRFERDEDGFLNGVISEAKPESLDLFSN